MTGAPVARGSDEPSWRGLAAEIRTSPGLRGSRGSSRRNVLTDEGERNRVALAGDAGVRAVIPVDLALHRAKSAPIGGQLAAEIEAAVSPGDGVDEERITEAPVRLIDADRDRACRVEVDAARAATVRVYLGGHVLDAPAVRRQIE